MGENSGRAVCRQGELFFAAGDIYQCILLSSIQNKPPPGNPQDRGIPTVEVLKTERQLPAYRCIHRSSMNSARCSQRIAFADQIIQSHVL